ncbi:high light inducible protein [Cyanobium sp. Morenito 9A2]|uniref:high light inducible protein n=1 Tax=Cyanobium sp. Morenito 9A2 TaxID=2823718 RepID=UPI0020CDDF5D|nr:high light inducible protein [Cyanobium sp. Morenito 9A2]MCP9848305.1 high light inducible protein [Cyanobium sp. Morenito 9A2]
MAPAEIRENGEDPLPVGPDELNAWRRGFTPQAEIWNGRLAMLGLSLGIGVLLIVRLLSSSLTAAQ